MKNYICANSRIIARYDGGYNAILAQQTGQRPADD
jgi:hypothetical protein